MDFDETLTPELKQLTHIFPIDTLLAAQPVTSLDKETKKQIALKLTGRLLTFADLFGQYKETYPDDFTSDIAKNASGISPETMKRPNKEDWLALLGLTKADFGFDEKLQLTMYRMTNEDGEKQDFQLFSQSQKGLNHRLFGEQTDLQNADKQSVNQYYMAQLQPIIHQFDANFTASNPLQRIVETAFRPLLLVTTPEPPAEIHL